MLTCDSTGPVLSVPCSRRIALATGEGRLRRTIGTAPNPAVEVPDGATGPAGGRLEASRGPGLSARSGRVEGAREGAGNGGNARPVPAASGDPAGVGDTTGAP